jgi:hypothetical protein
MPSYYKVTVKSAEFDGYDYLVDAYNGYYYGTKVEIEDYICDKCKLSVNVTFKKINTV